MWMMICWRTSGGHFNPSFTLAILLNSKNIKENLGPALLMMLGQLMGGCFGLFLSWAVVDAHDFVETIHHTVPLGWVAILAPNSASYGYGNDLGELPHIGYTRDW